MTVIPGKLSTMTSAFGTSLLITGPESLLASRIVADTKRRALAAHPEADINEIQATELADSMLSEVVGGSLFSSHIIAIIDDVGACPPEVVDQLVAVAADPPEDLCLILVHQGGMKGKGLVDKLKKAKVQVEQVAAIKPWELPKFVAAEAKRHKVRRTSRRVATSARSCCATREFTLPRRKAGRLRMRMRIAVASSRLRLRRVLLQGV